MNTHLCNCDHTRVEARTLCFDSSSANESNKVTVLRNLSHMRKACKYTIQELCHLHVTSTVNEKHWLHMCCKRVTRNIHKQTQFSLTTLHTWEMQQVNIFRTQISEGFHSRPKPTVKPQTRQSLNVQLDHHTANRVYPYR